MPTAMRGADPACAAARFHACLPHIRPMAHASATSHISLTCMPAMHPSHHPRPPHAPAPAPSSAPGPQTRSTRTGRGRARAGSMGCRPGEGGMGGDKSTSHGEAGSAQVCVHVRVAGMGSVESRGVWSEAGACMLGLPASLPPQPCHASCLAQVHTHAPSSSPRRSPPRHLHGVDAHRRGARQPVLPKRGVDAEVVHAARAGMGRSNRCYGQRRRWTREAGGRRRGRRGGPAPLAARRLTCRR